MSHKFADDLRELKRLLQRHVRCELGFAAYIKHSMLLALLAHRPSLLLRRMRDMVVRDDGDVVATIIQPMGLFLQILRHEFADYLCEFQRLLQRHVGREQGLTVEHF